MHALHDDVHLETDFLERSRRSFPAHREERVESLRPQHPRFPFCQHEAAASLRVFLLPAAFAGIDGRHPRFAKRRLAGRSRPVSPGHGADSLSDVLAFGEIEVLLRLPTAPLTTVCSRPAEGGGGCDVR